MGHKEYSCDTIDYRNVCERHQHLVPAGHGSQEGTGANQVRKKSLGSVDKVEGRETAEVGVQAGKPTLHHYLFDPTQDAVFEERPSR